MEYNKLETGKSYTLKDLFSKDNKIIIPDLQRDYCWGMKNKDGIELVSNFVKNIKENGFGKNETELNLGLIYGYEVPMGHIQLCDGQQRITTLFLLLGMINRNCNNAFQAQLISKTELDDDKEPYLQYAIRESSLYFLSDLVVSFFLKSDILFVDDIKKQPWYFKDYDLDPSIKSMLSAMKIIEDELKGIDVMAFGEYLIQKLLFIYYDMGSRKNGEETFVIINTTGEPLSATENLKPKLINAQAKENQVSCSDKWEEWETYFWQHRKGNGTKENDTADNGLKEFFRWITLLNTKNENVFKKIQESGNYQFDINIIDFSTIQKYFDITKVLFEEEGYFKNNLDWLSPDKGDKFRNDQIVWFRLLPVIEYVKRFGHENKRNVIRVKNFFENLSRIDNVSRDISNLLPEAIRLIKNLPNADIASVLDMENVSKSLLTEEEKEKFNLYKDSPNREKLEDKLWESERHEIFRGEITPLLRWSENENGVFSLDQFSHYYDVFCQLFHDDLEYEELDITRRALLTRNLKDYPRTFYGYTNVSFCWKYSDWQTLINDNIDNFGKFLYELQNKDDIYAVQKEMIDANPTDKDYDEFVKIPELLEFCEQKNMQWAGDKYGWLLLRGRRASGRRANLKSYRIYLDLKKETFDSNWEGPDFWDMDETCAFFDWKEKNIAIGIFYNGNDKYVVQLFRRNEEVELYFAKLASPLELKFNGERYESAPKIKDDIIPFVKQVMDEIKTM